MHDAPTVRAPSEERRHRQHRVFVLAAVTLVTFFVLAGVDVSSAQQVFDITLGETIQTIESGSAVRQIALLGFAGVSVMLLVTGTIRRPEMNPIIVIPLGALLALIVASALWAIDPGLTFRRIVALSLMLVGVFVVSRMLTLRQVVLGVLLFTIVFVAVAVAVQFFAGPFTPSVGGWRLAGIVHPVALSWYCGLGAISAFAVARFEPVYRIPAGWAVVVFLACLLLTKTRTGLGATLGALVILWLLTSKRGIHHDVPVIVTWLALFAFLVALAFPGSHFSWTSLYASTVEASSFGRTDAIEQIATFTGRLPVWEASLTLASQRPLLGFGYSAFQSAEMIPILAEAAGWVPTSTHSGYIDALLSLGVVGFVLIVLVLGSSVVESVRMARTRPYYAFATAVLVWLLVNLAFEAPVLFDPIFSSFVVFVVIFKIAIFPDRVAPFGRP